jgi:hypothetical protein
MSVGDILDGIAVLFRRHPLVFLGIGMLQQAPGLVFNLEYGAVTPVELQGFGMVRFFGWLFVITLVQALIASLSSPVIARLAAADFLDRPWPVRETLGFVMRRAPRLVLLTIVVQAIVFLATCALILPGIYATLLLAIAVPVCIVEDCPAMAAAARSLRLMRWGWHPMRLLGLLALLFGALTLLASVLAFVQAQGLILPETNALATWALGSVSTPLFVLAVTLFYFDLRIRREGFDLALLAAGSPGPSASSSPRSVCGSPISRKRTRPSTGC